MPWWPDKLPEPRRSEIRNRIIELRAQGWAYGPIAVAIGTEFGECTDKWAVGRAVNQATKEGLLQPEVCAPKSPESANPTWYWSAEEVEILKVAWAAGESYRQIQTRLPLRSTSTIERKRRDLGLPPRGRKCWWDRLEESERQAAEHDKYIPYTIKELVERFGVWKENIRFQLRDRGIRWKAPDVKSCGDLCWFDKLTPADLQHIKGNVSLLTPIQWAKRLNIGVNTVYGTFKSRGIDWPDKGMKSVKRPVKVKTPIAKPRFERKVKPPPLPPPPTQSVEDWLRTHQITQCPERPAFGVSREPSIWDMIFGRDRK